MKKVMLVSIAFCLVAVAAFSQDWSEPPTYGDVELEWGFSPDPFTVDLEAGGNVDLEGLGYYGYVNNAPDFDLQYTAGDYPLTIRVESKADTVLLISDPSGDWLFSDDEQGLNPGVTLRKAQSGLYDIWVGTVYSDEFPSARLIITEMD